MGIWKKALSVGLAAAMLASVAATSAFAATNNTSYLGLCAPVSCSVQADGISRIQVFGAATTAAALPGGSSLLLQIAGATFSTATADANGFTVTNSTTATIALTPTTADFVTVIAPSVTGSALISAWLVPAAGNATSAGTFSVDFYAAGSTPVSAANSTVTASKTTVIADPTSGDFATVTVVVKDGVSPTPNAITSGINVSASITPVGLVGGAQVSMVSTSPYVFTVKGSGIPGNATLSVSVTNTATSATTNLAPVAFVFSGSTASVAATGVHTVGQVGKSSMTGAVTFVTKDSAGNATISSGSTVVVTGTALSSPANGAAVSGETTASNAGTVNFICGSTPGSSTIAVKSNGVTSNAVTVYCSDPADTYSVAFADKTVAPGGQTTINVTVKDDNGFPAPDGLPVSILVSSGATLALTGEVTANGVASWTYLAPFNTGVVTVLASANVLTTTSPQSASITVGTPAPISASGTNASALGVTKVGPYTTATKVAELGKYVTFKMALGAAAAGQHVSILIASKSASGVWSTFAVKTARIADASGNVYFYWKSASAAWLSVRGSLNGAMTNAVQARWR